MRRRAVQPAPAAEADDPVEADAGVPAVGLAVGWSTPTSLRANLTSTGGGAGGRCSVLVDGDERRAGACPEPGGSSVAPTVPADGRTDHVVQAVATNAAGTGRSAAAPVAACCA